MGSGIDCRIKNYKTIKKELENMKKAPQKVLQSTVSDMKNRAPGWIATEVANVYNIKKSELKPGERPSGKVKVVGTNHCEISVRYMGRRLTPVHFGMSPKTPKQSYTLKAEIFKGQKKTLGRIKKITKKQRVELVKNLRREGERKSPKSPYMLMHTHNTQENGTDYIPFQRKSTNRNDIHPFKTVSLPQMVDNAAVNENISKVLNENLGKRLEHHMKRYGIT